MKKIKRTRLYEKIIEQIQEAIKSNELKPGDRLPTEKEMSEMYGVSRMVVREAMSALESAGLVDIQHGAGIFLKDVNKKILVEPLALEVMAERNHILNLLELRRGIESEAAYLSAVRATPSEIASLERYLKQMEREIQKEIKKDRSILLKVDFKFHNTIVKATKNPAFIKILETLIDIIYQCQKISYDYDSIYANYKNFHKETFDEHKTIFESIKNKDPEKARISMRKHIDNIKKRIPKEDILRTKRSG